MKDEGRKEAGQGGSVVESDPGWMHLTQGVRLGAHCLREEGTAGEACHAALRW